MERFLAVLARNAADTATYLLAYRGAPVAAIVAAVLLARCAPTSRFLSWARRPATGWSLAGGMALGVTRPLGRGSIGRPVIYKYVR